jgi:hypothetical protein
MEGKRRLLYFGVVMTIILYCNKAIDISIAGIILFLCILGLGILRRTKSD